MRRRGCISTVVSSEKRHAYSLVICEQAPHALHIVTDLHQAAWPTIRNAPWPNPVEHHEFVAARAHRKPKSTVPWTAILIRCGVDRVDAARDVRMRRMAVEM